MTGAWGPPEGEPAAASEESLLRGARAGERTAVERLYAGHVDWARRVAALLAGPTGAESLVSESFARAFGRLRAEETPSDGFGPHLLDTMSGLYRSTNGGVAGPPVAGVETPAATEALASLPRRMRRALWLVEVEGRRRRLETTGGGAELRVPAAVEVRVDPDGWLLRSNQNFRLVPAG